VADLKKLCDLQVTRNPYNMLKNLKVCKDGQIPNNQETEFLSSKSSIRSAENPSQSQERPKI
jgi:hypothetical protein